MPSNDDMKKPQRKADLILKERNCERGKRPHQKMKPYIVLQYLLKNTDEHHTASAFDIIAFLEGCGIQADRRSIYEDIKEINRVYWMMENDADMEEAIEAIEAIDASEDDEERKEKLIIYDKKRKGFYAHPQKYVLEDIALLAECIYATKFISGNDEKRLIGVIADLVSEHQAKDIFHDTFTVGRVKTANKSTVGNIHTLNFAMREDKKDDKHPQKVSFAYLTHEVGDVEKPVERKKKYVVSPYQLIINDGNYYLLAYDDDKKAMRTFRVDRIKSVNLVNAPREGKEEFVAMDMKTYTQRIFGMYGGEKVSVSLRCINMLLDTMIDRFGTKGVMYYRADKNHFNVRVEVEISDQFFSWVSGLGKRIKIETPEVAEKYKAFLDKIREMY